MYLKGAFQRNEVQEFRIRSLRGGSDRLAASFLEPHSTVNQFIVSPDGRRILTDLHYGEGTMAHDMAIVDLGGSNRQVVLPGFGIPMAWSPGGRFVLYGGTQRPRVLELATGKTWPLAQTDGPGSEMVQRLLNWQRGGADWAPDGSYVVLGLFERRTEARQWVGRGAAR
jgi:hypothetical protein